MSVKKSTVGRRFSKREQVTHFDGDGAELGSYEAIPHGYSLKADMGHFHTRALQVLRDAGFDPNQFADKSPHGSLLRETVLIDHESDSQIGLAAQIVECILHYKAYSKMTPPYAEGMANTAYRFGNLWRLFAVYEAQTAQARTASKQKRPNRLEPANEPFRDALRKQKSKGKKLKDAIRFIEARGDLRPDGDGYLFCHDGGEKRFSGANIKKLWTACDKGE